MTQRHRSKERACVCEREREGERERRVCETAEAPIRQCRPMALMPGSFASLQEHFGATPPPIGSRGHYHPPLHLFCSAWCFHNIRLRRKKKKRLTKNCEMLQFATEQYHRKEPGGGTEHSGPTRGRKATTGRDSLRSSAFTSIFKEKKKVQGVRTAASHQHAYVTVHREENVPNVRREPPNAAVPAENTGALLSRKTDMITVTWTTLKDQVAEKQCPLVATLPVIFDLVVDIKGAPVGAALSV